MKSSAPLALSLLVVLAVGAGASLGPVPLAIGVVLLVAALASGWAARFAVSGPLGGGLVMGATGAAGALAVLAAGSQPLAPMPVLAAAGLVACFVHQLLRRAPRTGLVDMLAAEISGVLVVLSSSGWVAVLRPGWDRGWVFTGGVALIVALLCTLLPWPPLLAGPFAVVLGTGSAVLVAHAVGVPPAAGAAAGFVITGLVGISVRLLGGVRATLPAGLVLYLAPTAAAGTVIYAAERLLVG